jgi:hypothetical protein
LISIFHRQVIAGTRVLIPPFLQNMRTVLYDHSGSGPSVRDSSSAPSGSTASSTSSSSGLPNLANLAAGMFGSDRPASPPAAPPLNPSSSAATLYTTSTTLRRAALTILGSLLSVLAHLTRNKSLVEAADDKHPTVPTGNGAAGPVGVTGTVSVGEVWRLLSKMRHHLFSLTNLLVNTIPVEKYDSLSWDFY